MDLQLTIDCADPARLVAFWAEALDYVPRPAPAGFATWNAYYRSVGVPEDELDLDGDGTDRLIDPQGSGPRIWFQVVPEAKQVKNRLHLDVYPAGQDAPIATRRAAAEAKVTDLLAAGATLVRRYPEDDPQAPAGTTHWYRVLADPEGNEFCVG